MTGINNVTISFDCKSCGKTHVFHLVKDAYGQAYLPCLECGAPVGLEWRTRDISDSLVRGDPALIYMQKLRDYFNL